MKKIITSIYFFVCLSLGLTLQAQDTNISEQTFPFRNTNLSLDARVNDLVSRMTLEEKVSQMQHSSEAIPRLGIPKYNWWNECLHGVGRSGDKVTVFPQAIGMAATFNPEALFKTANIISDEARAIYNDALDNGKVGEQYKGLTFWSPNINIFRDPRWGRGQETYGEDPHLTAILGKAFVKGLQGDDPIMLKTSACAKHYAVHSGPEYGRHSFDVTVSKYDLWDTYLPAFQALVLESDVSSVMCAYNRYAGQPCCGNDALMIDILRNQWNFEGYVTSDCGAIDDFYKHHKTHEDVATASADAVLHGTDLDCGEGAYNSLLDAVKRGLIAEGEIDISLKRLMKIRFRLGMFDSRDNDPYKNLTYDILEAPEHKKQALEMARQSIVLLKNKNNILPLTTKYKKIVVMGPNANDEEVQLGNYNGFPSQIITPLMGVKNEFPCEVVYVKGTGYTEASDKEMNEALASLDNADLVIFVGGISPRLEGEEGDAGKEKLDGFMGGDRTSISLPKVQTEMMMKIKSKKIPLIFACMSGSAIGYEWEAQNADAILQIWYGGQSIGTALADVLSGNYNPSGRLPLTFYKSDKDLPHFFDYSMQNRTYRYFTGNVLYPFGYGLSYTRFDYSWILTPMKHYMATDIIECEVEISNVGKKEGDEVVQFYINYPQTNEKLPLKELCHFERISIKEGENQKIKISLPVSKLQKWDEDLGKLLTHRGKYTLYVGGHSNDKRIISNFEIK